MKLILLFASDFAVDRPRGILTEQTLRKLLRYWRGYKILFLDCREHHIGLGRKNPEMTGVFEIISMCLSFCHNPNAEIVAEGDVYPRPRYHCPASYLELFDAFVRADGQCTGNMKYMLDLCLVSEL